jgi:REP element-mobilizing transposase RayT
MLKQVVHVELMGFEELIYHFIWCTEERESWLHRTDSETYRMGTEDSFSEIKVAGR